MIDEITLRIMIKESTKELKLIRKEYLNNPTEQLRFDLKLKVLEVGLLKIKLKNIRQKGT